jgi:hypothetical protein
MEMVNQMSLCVSDKALESNNGVCASKIKMKMIMADKKKEVFNMSK